MRIYTVDEFEQGSNEWHDVRLGKCTASEFKRVLPKREGRKSYMLELIVEKLSGKPFNDYQSFWMQRGNDLEKNALAAYEFETGDEIGRLAFIELSEFVGCSPDAVVGEDGLVQVKCPKSSTHIDFLLTDKIPKEYIPQVQGEMWVSGRQWNDFVSYCPELEQDIVILRVMRDEEYIAKLKKEIGAFVEELQEKLDRLGYEKF